MKKLLFVIATLLLLNSKSFSQTDTGTVKLSPAVALAAITDIIKGDEYKVQVQLLSGKIVLLDSIIGHQRILITSYQKQIDNNNLQLNNTRQIQKNFEDQLRKEKRRSRMKDIAMVVLAALAGWQTFR